jgi:hypothetical protein
MATTEETRKELARLDARRRDIVQVACANHADPNCSAEDMANTLGNAMIALSNAWRAEAISLEDSTKRGAKGMRERLRASAEDLAGFAGGLAYPDFLKSLGDAGEAPVPPDSLSVVTEHAIDTNALMQLALPEQVAADAADAVDPVIAYLKGDSEEIPMQSPIVFVAPATAGPERLSEVVRADDR